MNKINQSLWILGGTVCLALGALGILLPVLPTTPFLLLAAYCYGRGSKRFHQWLVHRSWIGGYIRNYQSGRGVPLKQKVWAIGLLWLTILASIIFAHLAWWVSVLLIIVAIGVTIHLVRMKTWRPESPMQNEALKASASKPLTPPPAGLPVGLQSGDRCSGD